MTGWSHKYGYAEYDLCKLFNGDYKLYKYYDDDEERYDEVPDILDYLYDMLDSAQDKYDDLQYESEGNLKEYQKRRIKEKTDDVKASISTLTKLIDHVSEERCEYYYAKGFDVVPIQVITLPIQTPDAVDSKLVWKDTGVSVDVFAAPRIIGDSMCMCYVPLEDIDVKSADVDTVYVWDYRCSVYDHNAREYRLNSKAGYIGYFEPQKEWGNVTFTKCKDCGNIFGLGVAAKEWYADTGLSLPKRCKYCRIKRV